MTTHDFIRYHKPMEYLTPAEIAERLKVTRRTVYKWIDEGKLQAYKVGVNVRIKREDLEAFIKPYGEPK